MLNIEDWAGAGEVAGILVPLGDCWAILVVHLGLLMKNLAMFVIWHFLAVISYFNVDLEKVVN